MRIVSSGVGNIDPCPLFFSEHTVEIGLHFFQIYFPRHFIFWASIEDQQIKRYNVFVIVFCHFLPEKKPKIIQKKSKTLPMCSLTILKNCKPISTVCWEKNRGKGPIFPTPLEKILIVQWEAGHVTTVFLMIWDWLTLHNEIWVQWSGKYSSLPPIFFSAHSWDRLTIFLG